MFKRSHNTTQRLRKMWIQKMFTDMYERERKKCYCVDSNEHTTLSIEHWTFWSIEDRIFIVIWSIKIKWNVISGKCWVVKRGKKRTFSTARQILQGKNMKTLISVINLIFFFLILDFFFGFSSCGRVGVTNSNCNQIKIHLP